MNYFSFYFFVCIYVLASLFLAASLQELSLRYLSLVVIADKELLWTFQKVPFLEKWQSAGSDFFTGIFSEVIWTLNTKLFSSSSLKQNTCDQPQLFQFQN